MSLEGFIRTLVVSAFANFYVVIEKNGRFFLWEGYAKQN
jgi:hypothetical protein